VTRRCEDPAWLVLRAPLREERRGRETAYYLTGTLKNTCNTALVAQLELRGVTDGGALFALPAIEPVALMPGEERPLFRSLGQYPRGAMAALQVVVRCRDGAADLPPDRPPPLCGEPGG
jgi:hypothetical protein